MSLTNTGDLGRRGVALPLALFTLVIAAVMITAVFYVGRLEQRMGYNSLAATQAFEAAETGVTSTMAGWSTATYGGMAPGDSLVLPATPIGGNSTWTAKVRRLNPNMFLIQAEGRFLIAGEVVTRRQVARIVKLDPAPLNPNAALTSRLGLDVGGSAQVTGVDIIPAAWSFGSTCPAAGSNVAAIRDSTGNVTTSGGCAGGTCLSGDPSIQTDPSITTNSFTQFGFETYAGLAAIADKVYASGTSLSSLGPTFSGGTCSVGDNQNWGDPDNPSSVCGNFFPVVHGTGNLTLAGGAGQGILLVDGDLHLSGDVRFYGVAIVQGNVITDGGSTITGALMVNNVLGTPTTVDSTTRLNYSRCAINRANTTGLAPSPLQNRSWIQMY